jgi:uncharacterized protein YuzE
MKAYNPTTFNGMIIFKKDNLNFVITNTNEEIEELIKNVPVLINDDIVGYVKGVEFWYENNLIGDIFVWNPENFYPVFKNYEVYVDENRKITGIACIEFEEKPT